MDFSLNIYFNTIFPLFPQIYFVIFAGVMVSWLFAIDEHMEMYLPVDLFSIS